MRYRTDASLEITSERLERADNLYAQEVIKLFIVANDREDDSSLCGNVRVAFNKASKALLISANSDDALGAKIASYEQISSALALYRTIALFRCGLNASLVDFYKLNWEVILTHKESGLQLGLGEWKGGFQIFTPARSLKELPAEYVRDVEMLLTLLVSDRCPIGYDGVVAGCIA